MIESNLLMKIATAALESMSPDDIRVLGGEFGIKNTTGLTAQTLTANFQAIFRAGGFKSYQLTLIVVNQIMKMLIRRVLILVTNATLMLVIAILSDPIG